MPQLPLEGFRLDRKDAEVSDEVMAAEAVHKSAGVFLFREVFRQDDKVPSLLKITSIDCDGFSFVFTDDYLCAMVFSLPWPPMQSHRPASSDSRGSDQS